MPASSVPSLPDNTSHAVASLRTLKRSNIVPLPTASNDETCCICLNVYGPSHKAVTVLIKNCYHRFGQQCLNDYLDSDSPRNNTCPQCRREWYIRQAAWMTPRDINITENLVAFSLSREPEHFQRRVRAHRTQRTLAYDQATNHGLINSHLDEIFRRLELIQNVSIEQHTSTANTRVRLQAIERRARRLYRELQEAHEEHAGNQVSPNATIRGQEVRRHLSTSGQGNRPERRRWIEAHALELGGDPYSLISGMNHSRITAPRTVSTSEGSLMRTNTYLNSTSDINREHPSSPPEDPISPDQYVEYLRWGQDRISDDELPGLREFPEYPAISSDSAPVRRETIH